MQSFCLSVFKGKKNERMKLLMKRKERRTGGGGEEGIKTPLITLQ